MKAVWLSLLLYLTSSALASSFLEPDDPVWRMLEGGSSTKHHGLFLEGNTIVKGSRKVTPLNNGWQYLHKVVPVKPLEKPSAEQQTSEHVSIDSNSTEVRSSELAAKLETAVKKESKKDDPNHTTIKLLYWHFSDDDPSDHYKINWLFSRLIRDINDPLNSLKEEPDVYIFTGLWQVYSTDQLEHLCNKLLSRSLGEEETASYCALRPCPDCDQEIPRVIYSEGSLIISAHPIRTIKTKVFGSKFYCTTEHNLYQHTTAYGHSFEVNISDNWFPTLIVYSEDYTNLGFSSEIDLPDAWKDCISRVIPSFKQTLFSGESSLIITRAHSPALKNFDWKSWTRGAEVPFRGNQTDFDTQNNSLAQILNVKHPSSQSQQITRFFHYRKGKKSRPVPKGSHVESLSIKAPLPEVSPASQLSFAWNHYWGTYTEEMQDYSPYYPSLLTIRLNHTSQKAMGYENEKCSSDCTDTPVETQVDTTKAPALPAYNSLPRDILGRY